MSVADQRDHDVERPAADVFAYATDPSHFPEWQKGVVDGYTDEARKGALCVTTRRIGSVDRPVTSEITHIDVSKTWGVRGTDGPVRAIVDVTVEPLGDCSSRLTITVEFAGRGIGTILVPLVVLREARKEMPTNLAALKRRVEGAT